MRPFNHQQTTEQKKKIRSSKGGNVVEESKENEEKEKDKSTIMAADKIKSVATDEVNGIEDGDSLYIWSSPPKKEQCQSLWLKRARKKFIGHKKQSDELTDFLGS